MSFGEIVVAADILLAIIQARVQESLPVVAAIGARRGRTLAGGCGRAGEVGQRVLTHLINHGWQWLGDRPLIRSLQCNRERIGEGVTAGDALREIAAAFSHAGNASHVGHAADFPIPFLAPEEEQLVLLDRTAQRVAEIVTAKNRLVVVRAGIDVAGYRIKSVGEPVLRCVLSGKPVIGIQSIVAAIVENAAMPLVRSTLGHNADDSAGGLAIFCTIGVAQHLELLDGFDGRIDKNRPIRTYVVVVRAIDEKQVVVHGVSVDAEVDATR